MMKTYVPLYLLALAAMCQALPTINHFTNETSDYFNDENEHSVYRPRVTRRLKHFIDGNTHHIKLAGVTYRQRLHDGQCTVEYGGQYLTENSVIQIRKKLYRVENCLLERVFHACGPNLLLMLNVVCQVVEKSQPITTTTPLTVVRRETTPIMPSFLYRLYPRASKTPRVITESCCESLCTISELSRYCHR